MQARLLLIRHGNTVMDDKVDATLNPPLDREGVERIKRTVAFVRNSGYEFRRIITSPLQRALRVAEMLSNGNAKIYPNQAAIPWNLGDLQGLKSADVKTQIENLENYPDLRAPHGESYRSFHTRWNTLLQQMLAFADAHQDETLICTTHSRNVNDAVSSLKGLPVGDVEEVAPEGSVTLLAKNGVNSEWESTLIWEGK